MDFSAVNGLSVDVEDYYQVSAFEQKVPFEKWIDYPSRVESSTEKVLEILDAFSVKATFFILGWIAETYPGIVKKIHSSGHEIASHGYKHSLIYNLSPEPFREDIKKTSSILEDITGENVRGFRGASFSVTKKSIWALDILAEEGLLYDSSIYPIHHDRYGIPTAPADPFEVELSEGKIIRECPPLSSKIRGKNFPMGGGGYLRFFPVSAIIRTIKKKNAAKIPAVIYFHPWELDPGQPFIDSGSRITNIRHRTGLERMEKKLKKLLSAVSFSTISQMLNHMDEKSIPLPHIKKDNI